MEKPRFIAGDIRMREYDGVTNDLLTGGLGKTGLAQDPPVFENQTPESLRTLAMYYQYRSILDISPAGGYGRLYGPNVRADGSVDKTEGMIQGREYLAYGDDGTGEQNIVLMVQVPDTFDPANPRILATASSGSRGVYGAVPVVGDWGLKRGFAVAYTDKGTGTGAHELDTDRVHAITGERKPARDLGKAAHFAAKADDAFKKAFPHRFAMKHAHSGRNPQKDWGKFLLWAVEFAFYILNLPENQGEGAAIGRENSLVIAAGISNGGDAALRAAEQDTAGLIHGVVASEPNIHPRENPHVVVIQGDTEWRYPERGKSMLDYHSLINLYQPCANLCPENQPFALLTPQETRRCENRCQHLAKKGLLVSETLPEMAKEAQKIINDYGILSGQNPLQAFQSTTQMGEGICVTYANAFGRFSVTDNLAGYSFAGVDPETLTPAPLPPERAEALFAESSGLAPSSPAGIQLIHNESSGGAKASRHSCSPDGQAEYNTDGALRLRRLATGRDRLGRALQGEEAAQHERIRAGIAEIQASGDLRGKPAMIVQGRDDGVIAPNHAARPYLGLNHLAEGESSRLKYYEILSAHHLDSFNILPMFASRFIPLQYYFSQALDRMAAHLSTRGALPPSQVVRPTPRGMAESGDIPELRTDHLPDIADSPTPDDRILITEGRVKIPD